MIRVNQIKTSKVYSKSCQWDPEYERHFLVGTANVVDLTNMTPKFVGQKAVLICPDSTNDCTVKAGSGVTFDGTNNLATFGEDFDNIDMIAASLTRWVIGVNNGVVLSAV